MGRVELKAKYIRGILVLMVGFVLTIMLFIWYKQYSFRSLKIYSLPSKIDNLETNTISTDGHELKYKETRYFIKQWLQSDYYVADIVNNSQSSVYISFRTIKSEKYNKILNIGESISLEYSTSDIIDIYSDLEDVPDISIEVNNYEYMSVLKQVVKGLIVFSVVFTAIISFLSMRIDIYNLIKKVLMVSIVISVVVSFLISFLNLYPHIYTACEYLTVFLGVMLILLGVLTDQIIKPVNNFQKLVSLCVLVMGTICFVLSQMLNSTKGWLTYFSAWNHKAVFDYVVLNGVMLVIIIIGMACIKTGYISVITCIISCKEFLYSIVSIEFVLMMPLTSWRTDMSLINGISLIVIESLIILSLQHNLDRNKNEIKSTFIKYGKLLLEAIILFATVVNSVQINYWYSDSDIYHYNWYFNSVYDVANNLPFTGGYMELYGHFALFYKLPLLILGNSIFSLFLITALFMVISLICMYFVAHKLIKKYIYRISFEICLFVCFTREFAYPMNLPHRLLFPSVLVLFMINNKNKCNKKSKILGYFICLLAVLWSTEVGIFCCAIYIAYIALLRYRQINSIKSMIVSAIKNTVLIPASLVFSYCIVQLYNYIVMGRYTKSYTINSFLGVLVDKDYMSSGQYNTFYFENAQWIYYWIFLFAIFIFGLYKLGLFGDANKKNDNNGIEMCIISSIGLAFMVIVLSRPEDYRLVISWILLLSFMIIDRINLNMILKEASFLKNISIILIIPIIVLVANCTLLLPDVIYQIKLNIVDYKRFNYEIIKNDELQLEDYPIEDIYAVGNGMKLLYFDMGYKLDNGNGGLAPEGTGKVEELMLKTDKKYIFTDSDLTYSNYKKIDEIAISNKNYSMYERIR